MLSTDLTHLPIMIDYNLGKYKFEPTEIAEVVLNAGLKKEYQENLMGLAFGRFVDVPKRKDLLYVACLNPRKNVLIVGHPDPETNQFIDPYELSLDNILRYSIVRRC